MSRIKEDQLKKLQELVGTINNLQMQVGGFELQKHQALHHISEVQGELNVYQKELEAEYGKVSINLQDGTVSEDPKQDAN
jgi:allophanate hydrolase subunit 1